MISLRRLGCLAGCWLAASAFAQIDSAKRDLLQLGYNGALEGIQPVSAYIFYYHNQPTFLNTNLALRLAVAPTFVDSELGIRRALGEHTDVGLGVAGGGFAYSYAEIDQGSYLRSESFFGHGAEIGPRVYHLFNPGSRIPLYGVVRANARFTAYVRDKNTDPNFDLPHNQGTFDVRAGFRWGGREPVLFPTLALALSIWYDGQYRTWAGEYGYHDREVEPDTHNFWAEASMAYSTEDGRHGFDVSLSAGTSLNTDRFSAYRMGALLPLISEFPLSLPGYYYQELSADSFVLCGANYLLMLDDKHHWYLNFSGATAWVDYLEGLEQPGNWNSGVGGGLLYRTGSWKMMVGYAYGIDAIRSHGRGANSIGVLMQLDWGEARRTAFNPADPNLWRGLQRIMGLFGS